jgi:hypothetical protein
MKKLNWNTILAILGATCELAPDLTGLATYLKSLHVGWLNHVAHGVGIVALLMASLPQIIVRLRAPLALLGLATPPGALAPWIPGKETPASDDVTAPVVASRMVKQPTVPNDPTKT